MPFVQSHSVLSEVVVAPGHSGAATGFALALAAKQMRAKLDVARALLWVRQDLAVAETGSLYGPGLVAFDIDPAHVVLTQLRTPLHVLRAGLEAARCPSLGVVVIETIAAIDFTASRRLKLAAGKSGVRVILLQHADIRAPTAAPVRWRVSGARSQASGRPAFDVTVLKHPERFLGQRHIVEWDREQSTFIETLSEPLATTSCGRPLAA